MAAVREACTHVVGAYGLAAVCADEPDVIAVARKDSPIVVGRGERGSYVASDVIALIDATRDVVVLEDGQFVRLSPEGITYTDAQGRAIEPAVTHVDWDVDTAEKGGYPDFMMKEICEQPRVVRDTLVGLASSGELDIDELGLTPEELSLVDRVYVIACGTSYHAGLIAKNLIEGWARIPCAVEAASEFRYRNPIITPSTLVVAVSQSGRQRTPWRRFATPASRAASSASPTWSVPPWRARAMASSTPRRTKRSRSPRPRASRPGGEFDAARPAACPDEGKAHNGADSHALSRARRYGRADPAHPGYAAGSGSRGRPGVQGGALALFVGRGMGSAISCEGAPQAQGGQLPACGGVCGGRDETRTDRLIEQGFPVIAVATKSPTYDKTVSNLKECEARGACIIAVATEGDEEITRVADHVICVPPVRDALSPITATVPLQLLAREVAVLRGCDVDQPRNLAKSVTVE